MRRIDNMFTLTYLPFKHWIPASESRRPKCWEGLGLADGCVCLSLPGVKWAYGRLSNGTASSIQEVNHQNILFWFVCVFRLCFLCLFYLFSISLSVHLSLFQSVFVTLSCCFHPLSSTQGWDCERFYILVQIPRHPFSKCFSTRPEKYSLGRSQWHGK